MAVSAPSALISDNGRRVGLRINGRYYEISQAELRSLLGVPPGEPGLGITIDRDRFCFEFSADDRIVELRIGQLQRLLDKEMVGKA
jgi:hypothetical protein